MNRLRKRVRIGKYAIPVLLLAILGIGTVAATVYVILTWTMTLPVVQYPRVNFYDWTKGTRNNTFTESFSIFPEVTTIQDNATCGIYSDAAGDCSMRISSIDTPANIDNVYIKVFKKGVSPILETTWTPANATTWVDFTTEATTYYTIWIEVTATTAASGSSAITLEMKVLTPA